MANVEVNIPVSTVYSGPSTIAGAMLYKVEEAIQSYSELAGRLAAAEGDRESALKAWVENSTDKQALTLRNKIAELNSQLNALAEKHVKSETLSDDDKAKLNEELKVRKQAVKDTRNAVIMVNTTMKVDSDNVLKALDTLGDPTRSAKGKPAGSAGATGPRVSADVTLTGGTIEGSKVFAGLSKAAIFLNADTKDLQQAYADAAKVDFESISKYEGELTFTFQPNANGAVYTVHTKTKPRAMRGSGEAATATTEAPKAEVEAPKAEAPKPAAKAS